MFTSDVSLLANNDDDSVVVVEYCMFGCCRNEIVYVLLKLLLLCGREAICDGRKYDDASSSLLLLLISADAPLCIIILAFVYALIWSIVCRNTSRDNNSCRWADFRATLIVCCAAASISSAEKGAIGVVLCQKYFISC